MSTYETETKFNRESRYYPSLADVLATHNAKVEHQPVAVIAFEDVYGKELAEWLFASVDEGGEMFDACDHPAQTICRSTGPQSHCHFTTG